MSAHFVIQRRHGSLTWCIDFGIGRTTKPWPVPIAQIPLTDADLELGGQALFDRWAAENIKLQAAAPAPPAGFSSPSTTCTTCSSTNRDEIHLSTASPGPLVLPDGRRVEIGDGLVIMSAYRFAQMVEAARFSKGVTEL